MITCTEEMRKMRIKIKAKEMMTCDVSPVAMFVAKQEMQENDKLPSSLAQKLKKIFSTN